MCLSAETSSVKHPVVGSFLLLRLRIFLFLSFRSSLVGGLRGDSSKSLLFSLCFLRLSRSLLSRLLSMSRRRKGMGRYFQYTKVRTTFK
jgi:hypothetical protein